MNLVEILKAKNIGDDVIQSIQEDMKANKIFTSSEENLDIRYGKLKTQHDGVNAQLKEANDLIATLKKSTEGQEDLQKKVADYEAQITTLQNQLEQTQIDADVHVELLAAGVKPDDIDYVMYKLKAKGELERGEDGKIKGMDDKIAALKTQLPGQFAGEKKPKILENRLPDSDNSDKVVTKEEFSKMGYNSRVAFKQENPELYNQMMKG